MRLFSFITLILLSFMTYSTVYKWVDKDGQVHYTDKPVNNAAPVKFKDNTENHVSLPQVPAISSSTVPSQTPPIQYQLSIIKPLEEETIRNNNGDLSVIAQVTPTLPPKFTLQLYLDDQILGQPQTSSVFSLKNIDRGTHRIIIKVLNKNGKILASSLPRTFFLHRSIKNRPS
ncbi:DUF4124 domain-containing protein [uncultured Shewanella sp.]|uniref:DUF4124 domain-containing protein n=1 Tax=uncultured Shewanella sp. TaxID=173975 RepID=UPI00262ECF51|nr:DUF4124 domain-containing protein [uncultured Shewanella sp.]